MIDQETEINLDSTELLCAELFTTDYETEFSKLADRLPIEYALTVNDWIENPVFSLSNPVAHAATYAALDHAIESDNPIQLENVMKTLFAMDEPSDELLDNFKKGHREVYQKLGKQIAAEITSGERSELFLHSCMYGGKSSLATYIIMELEAKYGYTKTVLITGELGDTKTRPRLLREKDEENSEYDWEAHRIFSGADPNHPNNIDQIKRIIQDEKGKSNKHILYFDEATFSSVEVLEEVKEICRENNIFFLGAGLNAGFLANKLPVMSHIEEEMKEEDLYECHAYTVFQDLTLGPIGTHTARAIKYKGKIYPDGLALPLLVTKEKPYIIYGAATAEHHATTSMTTEKDKQILMLQHRLAGITVEEIHNIQKQVSSGETLSWYHKLVLEVVDSQTKLQKFLELDAQEAA